MASELKVDKFTGVTTAGSIDVVGEGNSTTTNLQQGLAKAWINYDATASSDYTRDSFNVASTTDHAVGQHDITFSNVMANVNHAGVTNGHRDDNEAISIVQQGDTDLFRFKLNGHTNTTNTDSNAAYGAIFGELA